MAFALSILFAGSATFALASLAYSACELVKALPAMRRALLSLEA